jgi:hypothetical protein
MTGSAKQSISPRRKNGLLRRFAPRNDAEIHVRIPATHHARIMPITSAQRGRGECRAPDAPAAACARVESKSTRVSQVTPESPGIPHAMVLTASFVLSPVTGLSCHRHQRKLPSANLTPASGRQDHTTSPSASAPFVKGASTSTASRPASVTTAIRPSSGTRQRGFCFDLGQSAKEFIFARRTGQVESNGN